MTSSVIKNRLDKAKDILNQVSIKESDSLKIGLTAIGGIFIQLFNQGKRPTTYEISVRSCDYGNISGFTIDTIINEMGEDHETLKVRFSLNQEENVINSINRLATQDSDGTLEETTNQFSPIGLLWVKNN